MRQMSLNSMLAYQGLEPKLTKREEWVLDAIIDIEKPCTAAMVADHLGVGEHIVSGRFTGLKKKGKIKHLYDDLNSLGNKAGYYVPVTEEEPEHGDEW